MQLQILVNFGLGGRTMILADKIIEERKKNGWTQEDLAQKLGVSRQSATFSTESMSLLWKGT